MLNFSGAEETQNLVAAPKPVSIRIDASTHCQLKCPTCETTKGVIKRNIGSGFLRADRFRTLLDENPTIAHVELSNWGEIFLNPQLEEIMRIAHERRVALTAANGVNLNHARPETLEALVRHRFMHMTVSIDGASQETYEVYRVGGVFDRVIDNIKAINAYKKQYKSAVPILLWQFVAFGHNEHEIAKAKSLAAELGMHFYVKLSYDNTFSPIRNPEKVRSYTKSGAASRAEYREKTKSKYLQKNTCRQLWEQPVINWDGQLLGCCINAQRGLGNVFSDGLMPALNGEEMRYAKAMVTGQSGPRDGIPCTGCGYYIGMKQRGSFLTARDLISPLIQGLAYRLLGSTGRGIVGLMQAANPLSTAVVNAAARIVMSRMIK